MVQSGPRSGSVALNRQETTRLSPAVLANAEQIVDFRDLFGYLPQARQINRGGRFRRLSFSHRDDLLGEMLASSGEASGAGR